MNKLLAFASALVVSQPLTAAWLSRDDIGRATESFLLHDVVGGRTLSGRMTGTLEPRGNLWVVRLVPGGYVVFAGSDRVRAIVAFSANDFAPPTEGSAFADLLAQADAGAHSAETLAAFGVRHATWAKLLGGTDVLSLVTAAEDVAAENVIIEPFMNGTQWNQWQPYNDFSPVCEEVPDHDSYRGRTPCGCVATAVAQVFAYWQWPKYAETRQVSHSYAEGAGDSFDIRFDAGEPLDWAGLKKKYDDYYYSYDWRGHVDESVRYPIARLVLWCDSLVDMRFASAASSAHVTWMANAISGWYHDLRYTSCSGDAATAKTLVRNDLQDGCPVHVSIYNHAIVAHGWASDGTTDTDYVYVNYGWGGDDHDGWMSFGDLVGVTTGLKPRKTVQLDPLPAVCDTSVNLSWTLPKAYASDVTGFRIERSEMGTEVTDWTLDLPGGELSVDPLVGCSYEFAPALNFTSRSVLTYRMLSQYALGAQVCIEMKLDDGPWTVISTPMVFESSAGDWASYSVFLGDQSGTRVRFRISASHTGNYSYDKSLRRMKFSDITLSDVLAEDPNVTAVEVGPEVRSHVVADCMSGSRSSFTVTPMFGSETGETSRVALTSIAGKARIPVPGNLSWVKSNVTFPVDGDYWTTSDVDVRGDDADAIANTGRFHGSIVFALPDNGRFRSDSVLTFSWAASGYYGKTACYDEFSVVFKGDDGTISTLYAMTNRVESDGLEKVDVGLSSLAGRTGSVSLVFDHEGLQYSDDWAPGGTFRWVSISNVDLPLLPELAWEDHTYVTNAVPAILSVVGRKTPVAEGFYCENARGTNVLIVTCADGVTALEAKPSHLSILSDDEVSVLPHGPNTYAVILAPRADIPDRSRLILSLKAYNANGDVATKDLSLRFSSETVAEVYVPPFGEEAVVMTDGQGNEVPVPIDWFVKNGLVAVGGTTEDCAAAAELDADGDGLSNWVEYVLGTDPGDDESALNCTITFDADGVPNVDYSPKEGYLSGYKAVVKGKASMGEIEWKVKTTEHRFFRVFIERK